MLNEAAQFLIEKETITGKQFMEIFRRVRGEEPETVEVTSITLDESESGEAVTGANEERENGEAVNVPKGDDTGEKQE